MNQPSCDEIKKTLVDYLEFELPVNQREKIYQHLTSCEGCRFVHDDLHSVLAETKSLPVCYPEDGYWDTLPDKVLAQVKLTKDIVGQLDNSKQAGTRQKRGDSTNGQHADLALEDLVSDDSNVGSDSSNVIYFKGNTLNAQAENSVDDLSAGHSTSVAQADAKDAGIAVTDDTDTKKRSSWLKVAFPVAASIVMGVAVLFSQVGNDASFIGPVIEKYGFQAQIVSSKTLVKLAQQIAPLAQPSAESSSDRQFGFSSSASLFSTFSIGSMFSEASVFSKTEEKVLLKTQLVLLKTALSREKNPNYEAIDAINDYLNQNKQIQTSASDNEQLLTILNNYAGHLQAVDQVNFKLFKAGVWFFDYALAALAHDGARLRQSEELGQLKNELKEVGAPVGVIRSIDKMLSISKKGLIKTRDYSAIVREVENIRNLLG